MTHTYDDEQVAMNGIYPSTPEKETPTPKTVGEVAREINNGLASMLTPSNEAMSACRWVKKEIEKALTAQNQAARTAGYQAAVADLSGKPLTAIELMYDEAYARGYKEADERLREVFAAILEEQTTFDNYNNTQTYAGVLVADIRRIAKEHGITNL